MTAGWWFCVDGCGRLGACPDGRCDRCWRRPRLLLPPRPEIVAPPGAFLVAPLLRLTEGNQSALARRIGVSRRTVVRWVARGWVSDVIADTAAVACGYHPLDLWGETWLTCDAA